MFDEERAVENAGRGITLRRDGLPTLRLEALGDNADDPVDAGRPIAGIGEPAPRILDPNGLRLRPLVLDEAVNRLEHNAAAGVASARRHDRLVAR